MDRGPPSLLLLPLASLLLSSPFATGQPSYIIDAVGLQILPRSTVRSGAAVTLRCQVSVIHDNVPDLNHTFQLTRDSDPVFTRTTTDDSVVYALEPARAADSGVYQCRVMVKDKKRTSFSQTLTVTGLQIPVLLLSTTKPYDGEEFTAVCSAPKEKGSLRFRFYQRSGAEEPVKIQETASPETALVLRQATDSFLSCEYEISLVSSGSRRSNRSSEVQVVVQALFISPTMNVLPSDNVFEGEIVEIVCKVVHPRPGIGVFLTKDRRILQEANRTIVHRFTAQGRDSGEFVCKAEWRGVQRETYHSITVKELFSTPQLTVDPEGVFEGNRFTLTCSVSVYVAERVDEDAMRFIIYRDRVNLTESRSYTAVAEPGDNGNYTCEVSHKYPTPRIVKQSESVAVQAKVPVSRPRLSVVGGTLVLGKPFQLLCRSDSGTLPIHYTVFVPGLQPQHRLVSRPRDRGAVVNSSGVSKVADLDGLLCYAENGAKTPVHEFGQELQHSTRIIEPVSKPLLRPSTWSVTEGQTLTLVCSVNHGTTPVTFSWYRDKMDAPLKTRSSMQLEEALDITNVTREDEGRYYCVSTNLANDTRRSLGVSVAVTLAGWKKGLIAAVCVLLALTLVLGCICKRRLGKCQRKRLGELSVKSAGTKTERLSLTQAEFSQAANATPGMIGKSIWSEQASGSESDDQNSVAAAEPGYTEVPTGPADADGGERDAGTTPEVKGTDTVHSEVRNSKEGVPEQADAQGSVEYAQLNHDTDHHGDDGNHSNQPVLHDPTAETDNGGDIDMDAVTCEE